MERFRRASKNDSQDQYVLTVFLPLLAVAILLCIGGCWYMERRRRRRKRKNGGIDPEELRQQQDFDDTASVISTSSTRRRHYLDPTPTTGRLLRGVAVRSNYSTLGEPLYASQKRWRNSVRNQDSYFDTDDHMRSTRSDFDDTRSQRLSNRHRTGYGERPLSRSRSMVDVRYDHNENDDDDNGNFRRTRSSNNLNRYRTSVADSGYQENQSNDSGTENMYEFLNNKPGQDPDDKPNFRYNRPPSPAQSEWSVRTAPTMGVHDENMTQQARPSSRPSSLVDFPLRNTSRLNAPNRTRTQSLMRSISQPNLNALDSKTYPHGILKKGSPSDDRRLPGMPYQNSMDSGIKDVYGEIGDFNGRFSRMNRQSTAPNIEDAANMRPSSRPSSVMSYSGGGGGRQSYDPYFASRYGNYTSGAHQQQYAVRQPPPYSVSSNYHQHQVPATDKYAPSFNPYGGYGDYWGQQSHQGHRHRVSMY